MTMLDIHEEALRDVNEAHHTFLLRYHKGKRVVYGVVEGKDDPNFYRSSIERFLPDEWEVDLILAGNKSKVIDLHGALNWNEFPRSRIAFFIDRDLSAFTGEKYDLAENIYITDGYSIENSVVTFDVFLRLLVEAYNVVDFTDDEREKIEEIFNENMTTFIQVMTPIMAQILAWRLEGAKANLNNLNISALFRWAEGRIFRAEKFGCDADTLDHLCACLGAEKHDTSHINEMHDRLSRLAIDFRLVVRGKYLTWFLANALASLHSGINNFVAAYTKPPKAKLPLGASNILILGRRLINTQP